MRIYVIFFYILMQKQSKDGRLLIELNGIS